MPRRRRLETLAEGAVAAVAGTVVVAIGLIFVFVAREALPLLTDPAVWEEARPDRFFALAGEAPRSTWQPVSEDPRYGVWPLLVGSLKVTAVALAFAAPVSLGAAVYTSEFAPPRLREILKPVIELLAGIPSVVLGFFALLVMASWVQDVFGLQYRLNGVVAGLALGLAVVPVVFTVAEDALRAVPRAYRDAALALGARPSQVALTVVVPSALPGILAALILGLGRAIGETMIVLMASGNAAILSLDPTVSVRTLTATIAAELAEVVFGGAHYAVLFFLGAMLFVITFGLNLLAEWWVARLRRRLAGLA